MRNFWKRRVVRVPDPPADGASNAPEPADGAAAKRATSALPPASGFRLVRYFTVASLAAFVLVAAPLMYLERMADDFFHHVLGEQRLYFKQAQDGFARQHDETARRDLLTMYEAGNVSLTRLFANTLWEKDFAPFVAKARRVPVDRCRVIADLKDAGGKSAQPAEKQACYAGIGKQIMAFPEFRALDAKVFDAMQKSTVFKIKVYDLRGITIYSSEHNQIGEDQIANAGWKSAVTGKPASALIHRDKFNAFDGVVENRDLIESYVPVLAPGSEKIAGVFEIYSDVTPFIEQIENTSTQIRKLNAENQAQVERAVAANVAKADENANLLLAVVLGLFVLLYCALFLIVRHGQRIIDREKIDLERAQDALSANASRYRAVAETAGDAIITADAAGTIMGWNPAAERMFGYTEAEVIGQPLTLVIPHRYRAGHLDGIRRIQTGGERHVIGKSVELHGLTKAGREFPLDLALSEWETPEGRFFAGIIRDISERKRAELALVRQKDLYDMLSQTNQAVVRITGREELFPAVCRAAVEHGHFLFVWIGLINKDDQWLEPVAKYGDDAGYMAQLHAAMSDRGGSKRGLSWRALLGGVHTVANDFLTDPETAPFHEAARRVGVRSFAAFPIRQGGAVAGIINVYAGERDFFTADLLATLDEMATDVSFALDNFAVEAARDQAEETLRQAQQQQQALIESIDGIVWEADARTFQFSFVSPQAERLLGYPAERWISEPTFWRDHIHPDDRDWAADYRAASTRGMKPHRFEYRFVAADGRAVWLDDVVSVTVENGVPVKLRGLMVDVTERKRAEDALRAGEERYRELFQANPHPMWVYDLETLRFLAVNDAAAAHYGYTRDEFQAMTITDIYLPEDVPHVLEVVTRRTDEDIGKGGIWRHRRKNGTLIDVEVTAHMLDFDGRRARVVLAHDVTGRLRAEHELAESEQQFRGLVEQSIAGIYIIQDGKLAYVNPRFAEIIGYGSADELIGRTLLSIVTEKDRGAVAENIRRRVEGEAQSISYSLTALRKDGSTVEVGVHGARASFHGRPAIIGLLQDISDKKRAEEQVRRYVVQLETAFMSTVQVVMTLSEMRDPYTAGHERHVAEIAVAIGAELGFDARRQEGLRVAGYLHDIGNITIPSEILSKPGRLSPIESKLIQGHAQASYDVLKDVEFPWPVAGIALQHHERIDGSGYPQGLKGEAILLEARIMAVADVVEAMSSHRPYRAGLGIDKALAEIERGRGTSYDAVVADACLKLFREKGYAIPA